MLSQKNAKKTTLLPKHKSNPHANEKGITDKMSERIRNDKALANQNYLLYLSSLLRKTQIYHLWHQYLDIFRKFRLLSLLFRIYSYLLILLQFGTAFFILVVGLLLLLPILILSAGLVIFSALLLYRRENRTMALLLERQNIVVFFPTRGGELTAGEFWRAHIEDLSARPNTTVLIVSPHFWSGKGIKETRFYLLLRKEKDNVYLLRKHYYFSLRQEVLNKKSSSLTLIY